MKLHKDVLWVWYLRTLSAGVLTFPFVHILCKATGISLLWGATALCLGEAVALLLISIRFRTCRLYIDDEKITLATGVLIRRTLTVRLQNIYSLRTLRTPLLKKYGLHSAVIYCEGGAFLLPPVKADFKDKLRNKVFSEECST